MNKLIANNIGDRILVHDKNDRGMIEFIKKDGYFIEFYQGCSERKKWTRDQSKNFLKYGDRLDIRREDIKDLINYCEAKMNNEGTHNLNKCIVNVNPPLKFSYYVWEEEMAFSLDYNRFLFKFHIISFQIGKEQINELITSLKEFIDYNSEDERIKSEQDDVLAIQNEEKLITEEVVDDVNSEEVNNIDEINENNESYKN